MKNINISTSILSLSAPGARIAGDRKAARVLARQWNDYSHSIRADHPTRFGFFGALPFLTDTPGCITELAYALDELKADGITLFTSYDGKCLGHADFVPIWAELNARNAVRLHPSLPHPLHH